MNRLNPGKAINQKQDEADSQKTAATKTSRRQKMSSPRAKPGEACLDQARPGPNPIQPIRQNKSPTLLGTDEISDIEDIMDSLVKTPNPDKAVEEDVFFSSHQRCFLLEKMSSARALGYLTFHSDGFTHSSFADGYSHLYHEGQRGKDATPSIATGPNGQSDHLRDNSSKDSPVKTPNPDKAGNQKRVEEVTSQKTAATKTSRHQKMSSAGALGSAIPCDAGFTHSSFADGYSHLYHKAQRGKDATPSIAPDPNGQSGHLRDNSSKGCCCFPWGGK